MPYCDRETSIIKDIEKYRKLIDKKKDEITEMETIVDSLTNSLVDRVRKVYIPYSENMLYKAWCQQTNSDDEEREMYEFVTTDLIENLFKENDRKYVKFKKITSYVHKCYGYSFEYVGYTFEVRIPNVNIVDEDSLVDMDYGKYQLYYRENSNCWKQIKSSYKLEDIAKYIDNWLAWDDGVL